MGTHLTKKGAEIIFLREIMPQVKAGEQDGRIDLPARRMAWNDFTDMLCKEGHISSHQYETWTHPKFIR